MKVRTKFLMITILITLFLGMFFYNESFAVPDYGEPGSYNTAFSIELVCESLENYEVEVYGDYGYETRVYNQKILKEDFYVKIASLVDMGETIETSSFGILNYVGTEEIIGRHCYIYTAYITDKTIFDNKIIEDLRYPEYNFKFYYEIAIKKNSEKTDYKYTILADGNIEINEYIGYDKEIVEIPDTIDGYKVTRIGDNAFINEYLNDSETDILSHNRQHKKVIIPEGVIAIGEDAFVDCNFLSEVQLPSTLTSIGSRAFQNCTSLKEIIIPSSTNIIGIGAFWGNSSLEKVEISENITAINDSTFAYCTNLKEMVIPEKVQTIYEMAFYQCTSIEKIVIPKNVMKIEWEAFGSCTALEEIEFNETTTIEIEIGAFYDCPNLTKVVLPKTITEIKDNANTQYNTIFEGASSELIIYVENGSYAQQFCIDNNYNYHIEVRELKDLYVDIDVENKEFTGDAIETDIIITDGELILMEDIDYIVEYTENINVGTATLIINGIGNYAGTITKNFEIEAKDIATLTDIVINPCYEAYTGYPIYVSEGIKDGENELSNGWDYVIEYEDNINPGTATVIIKGQNNYKGEILRTYEIAKRDISNLIINVNTDDYIYTGEAIEPPVEIIYDGRPLQLNEDYEVSYKNNINAGTATIIITGKGYYTGTINKQFKIEPEGFLTVSLPQQSEGKTYTYTGQEIKLELIVKGYNNEILVENQDYIVEYSNNINVGLADIKVTGIGNYQGMHRTNFSIEKKDLNELEDITIDTSDKIYSETQEGIMTSINLKHNGIELKKYEDYRVFYSENNKVGIAQVCITGLGNYTGEIRKNYNIVPEDIQNLKISVDNISTIYTGKEIQPKIEIEGLTAWEDYTVHYEDCIDVGTMSIIITGVKNYTGTVTKKVEILPKNIQDITVSIGNRMYNGQEQKNIARFDALREGRDYIETYKNNINVGTATVIITGVGNYTGTITKNFNIQSIHIPDELITVDTSAKIYNGQEIKPTIGVRNLIKGTDYTVKYQNNINSGKAKIIITGIGNYTGTKEYSFEIKKANIKNNSTNYEGIYDGKEHAINIKVDIPNYDIKYSINNNDYNLNSLPSFKDVGDYTINYKITGPNYNDLVGSNKVRIYGVKQLDSTLEIRNNMLIVKNYKNNFTDLCNRIQLHANSKSYLHLNQNKNVINDLLVKTGEYIQLIINNSSTLEYKVSVLADVNGDGKISALDYVKIKNHIMKTNLISSDVYLTAADVNDDGKISALDYVRIKNYIMNGGV